MNLEHIYFTLNKVSGIGIKLQNSLNQDTLKQIGTIKELYTYIIELSKNYKRIKAPTLAEVEEYVSEANNVITLHEDSGFISIIKNDKNYPKQLLELDAPPVVFYAQGNIGCLKEDGIAVIGTRKISPFGENIGERFGEVIAKKGLTVISGLAEGADTSGHLGCLKAGGTTVAVVATPLNQVFPQKNTALAKEILEKNGCIISEYPIGTQLNSYNFIARDRLQCGLAKGVIVVETGTDGGALHAVKGAKKMNRPVGCFKYDAAHYDKFPDSRGNKMLIDNKTAVALYDVDSIDSFVEECLKEKNKAVQIPLMPD